MESFNLTRRSYQKSFWRGNHVWESGNLELVEYIVTDIHDGHVEIIDIVRINLYSANGIENYNEKVGEWLDTGAIIISFLIAIQFY